MVDGLRAYRRVAMLEAPSIEEINAKLFDMQLDRKNIITVHPPQAISNGKIVVWVEYQTAMDVEPTEDKNANEDVEEIA
jgi:hypothetical protein